jgi:urease accessory protein
MIAELEIETALRPPRTYLKRAFCTPPFKVADITEDKKQPVLQLMLMSSSPGILEGDVCRMKIDLAPNTALELHTQGYQRLFTMQQGASQETTVHLAPGACFRYIPHPVVPHKGARFRARNKIFLSDNCSLLWGEVLTCGRKLNGEVFDFTEYHNLTGIYLRDKLIVKENLLIRPAALDIGALGQMEGYTHQASLIFLQEKAPVAVLIETLSALLRPQPLVFGITALPADGLLVRLLGSQAEILFQALQAIARLLPLHQRQENIAQPETNTEVKSASLYVV